MAFEQEFINMCPRVAEYFVMEPRPVCVSHTGLFPKLKETLPIQNLNDEGKKILIDGVHTGTQ